MAKFVNLVTYLDRKEACEGDLELRGPLESFSVQDEEVSNFQQGAKAEAQLLGSGFLCRGTEARTKVGKFSRISFLSPFSSRTFKACVFLFQQVIFKKKTISC